MSAFGIGFAKVPRGLPLTDVRQMTLIADLTSTPFILSLRRCGELEAEVEDAPPATYMGMTCDCGATLARRVEGGLEGS